MAAGKTPPPGYAIGLDFGIQAVGVPAGYALGLEFIRGDKPESRAILAVGLDVLEFGVAHVELTAQGIQQAAEIIGEPDKEME